MFSFELVHVPRKEFKKPDGLSKQRRMMRRRARHSGLWTMRGSQDPKCWTKRPSNRRVLYLNQSWRAVVFEIKRDVQI